MTTTTSTKAIKHTIPWSSSFVTDVFLFDEYTVGFRLASNEKIVYRYFIDEDITSWFDKVADGSQSAGKFFHYFLDYGDKIDTVDYNSISEPGSGDQPLTDDGQQEFNLANLFIWSDPAVTYRPEESTVVSAIRSFVRLLPKSYRDEIRRVLDAE